MRDRLVGRSTSALIIALVAFVITGWILSRLVLWTLANSPFVGGPFQPLTRIRSNDSAYPVAECRVLRDDVDRMAPGRSAGRPRIYIEEIGWPGSLIDIGHVPLDRVSERVWHIVNRGDATLVIYAVSASCGCTAVYLDDMIVEPGERVPLRFDYDPRHEPTFGVRAIHTIRILSNDRKHPRAEFAVDIHFGLALNLAPHAPGT